MRPARNPARGPGARDSARDGPRHLLGLGRPATNQRSNHRTAFPDNRSGLLQSAMWETTTRNPLLFQSLFGLFLLRDPHRAASLRPVPVQGLPGLSVDRAALDTHRLLDPSSQHSADLLNHL